MEAESGFPWLSMVLCFSSWGRSGHLFHVTSMLTHVDCIGSRMFIQRWRHCGIPCQSSTLFDTSPVFECCIHTHPQQIIVNACKCLIPWTLNLQWASLFQFEILEATGTSEPCASRGAGQVWSPSSKLVYSPWYYSYINHQPNSQPFFLQFAATWLSKSDENPMTSQFLLVK